METPNPTIKQIKEHYYNYQCTITLRNRTTLKGLFAPGEYREFGIIKGWFFTPINGRTITILHDQIAIIQKPD